MARLLLLFFMSVFAWQIATVGSFMWMCVTRVSHPSQTPALALSRLLSDCGALLRLWSGSAGQRRILPAVGCLSPPPGCVDFVPCGSVSYLALWPAALPPDLPRQLSQPQPRPSQLLSTSYFQDSLISLSQCKIAPDICDYSKPLNCLFLLHLLGCDRLSFIFTATLHLLFLCGGLFMFVSVRRKPRLAGIHQCALS